MREIPEIDDAIQAEIQALLHVEETALQLYRLLIVQVEEVRKVEEQIKVKHNIPKPLKKLYARQDWWWEKMADEANSYADSIRNKVDYLDYIRESCEIELKNFKDLKLDIENI